MATAGSTLAGIEAGAVTAQRDINVSVVHTTAQRNDPGNPVSSFRIVDAPIDIFEGRQEFLAEIHGALLARAAETAYMKRIVALVAMGGMGKTELARKLVDVYKGHYKNVAWVDAETESSARQSFIKIAKLLKISDPEGVKGKDLAELVYRHIYEHVKEPSLFIFDNTNRLKTDGNVFGIFDYLPTQVANPVGNPPMILLTSQTTEWGRHCAVLYVTYMSHVESLNFFQSRFKLGDEEIREDHDLRGLLQILNKKLNGYPLALGLAAANISFIPGQGFTELLKRELQDYIDGVEKKEFMEQRVDTQLATEYSRTMSAVWDMAMENLQRVKFAMEAKNLLSILAHCPQEDLLRWKVDKLYDIKNANLGITFPDENDAIFEEALNALQTVGIDRVINADRFKIGVHRLVQELARLGDDKKIGIQKMSLQAIRWGAGISEEYLWSDEGISSWALEDDRTVLLWLSALRLQLPGGRGQVTSVIDAKWKKQLEKFRDGAGITVVADFILNHKQSYPNRLDDPRPENLWSCIADAVEAKSLLVLDCKDTRTFLELVLLSAIRNTVVSFIGSRLSSPSPDSLLASFRKWLSEFDFSAAVHHYSAVDMINEAMEVCYDFGKFCSYFWDEKLQLISTRACFHWYEATSSHYGFRPHDLSLFWVILLESIDLEEPDDVLVINRLLDLVSAALEVTNGRRFIALGILRKLVVKRSYVQHVIAKTCVMNAIKSQNPVSVLKTMDCLYLVHLRIINERRRLRGVFEGALGGMGYTDVLEGYGYIIVCLGLCINLSMGGAEAEARQTLVELLPDETCKRCMVVLSKIDSIHTHIHNLQMWEFYHIHSGEERFLTRCELDEDKAILSRTMDWLLNWTESPCEKSWEESLVQLIKIVQKFNQRLLSAMLDPREGTSVDEVD